MDDVGCAGIMVADIICGPMDALPEEGQLLALDSLPATAGGCASNVAINLGKQGIAADAVGCLGSDPAAQVVVNELHKFGVGTKHIRYVDKYPTSQTVILLVRGQDRRFIHVFGANKALTISQIDRDWLAGLKVLYLGGLFVLPGIDMDELRDLLQFCREKGVKTVLDVVIPHQQKGMNGLERVLPYVDYFVPNDDEAQNLTGLSEPLEQARTLQQCGADTVIITRGSGGTLALHGHDLWQADAFKVDTIDPSGGGDGFSAGIVMGILRGWDMPQMLTYGGILGASATLGLGTTAGVFTAVQVEQFLATHQLTISHETLI
ncbi:MAG: carbohydrate kinase family protein [Burkholderiales bacterium]|nr:carbohydrate kinase family protein [Anaerolineae bacterium]